MLTERFKRELLIENLNFKNEVKKYLSSKGRKFNNNFYQNFLEMIDYQDLEYAKIMMFSDFISDSIILNLTNKVRYITVQLSFDNNGKILN